VHKRQKEDHCSKTVRRSVPERRYTVKRHTLSPSLCKKARHFNAIIHISSDTESGYEVLRWSLSGVVTAVAIPVKYLGQSDREKNDEKEGGGEIDDEGDNFQPNTNLTVIYFSVRRTITMQRLAYDF